MLIKDFTKSVKSCPICKNFMRTTISNNIYCKHCNTNGIDTKIINKWNNQYQIKYFKRYYIERIFDIIMLSIFFLFLSILLTYLCL